jgi:hypothetical protein
MAAATKTINPDQARMQRRIEQERLCRTLLRKVDSILKSKGVDAALNALMNVRLKATLTPNTIKWLSAYSDMLMVWHAKLMPAVFDEFKKFGPRRARDIAHQMATTVTNERMVSYYLICDQVLSDMAERSRLAIIDKEKFIPGHEPLPQEISLEDVSEEELERGEML